MSKWFHIDSGVGEPAFNMAFDEALLNQIATIGSPALRFYGWTEPAATFGYFQKIADVEQVTRLRPLIRRPTGGGLVPHADDWTYSFTVPPGHWWYRLKAENSCSQMHQWLQSAFQSLGSKTELAPCCRKDIPGQCFAGYEKHDLLFVGRKLAGAAQRRNKLGLLIQGSIQPPPANLEREHFIESMIEIGNDLFNGMAAELKPDEGLTDLTKALAEERYRRTDYNRRR
ncbi:lipoate--protein ligase family protein [bacterium]|nr:lipoate--protein ligase family protein [bacterium]